MAFFIGQALPPARPLPPFLASVSSNGRYLLDQYGDPYLVNCDTAWGIRHGLPLPTGNPNDPVGIDLADSATYFSERGAQGFNSALVTVGNATDPEGNHPYSGSVDTIDGLTGTSTLDPNYWGNIDTLLAEAASNGMTLFLDPIDSYSANTGSYTTTEGTKLGNLLGARYATTPNIAWLLGNDWNPGDGGGGNTTPAANVYDSFITALRAQGANQLVVVEAWFESSLSSDTPLNQATWQINGAYTYHPTYQEVLRGYAFTDSGSHPRPVMFIEGAYENTLSPYPDTALDLRKEHLWSLTSGAPGTFYGNDSLWEFDSDWQTFMDTTMVSQRIAYFSLWNTLAWWKLVPDTGSALVTAGRNSQYTTESPDPPNAGPNTNDATYGLYVTAAVASDQSFAVIYNPGNNVSGITAGSTLTLSSTPLGGGSPSITRVDPTNGAQTSLAWTTTLTSPGNNAAGDPDWLYVITAS